MGLKIQLITIWKVFTYNKIWPDIIDEGVDIESLINDLSS